MNVIHSAKIMVTAGYKLQKNQIVSQLRSVSIQSDAELEINLLSNLNNFIVDASKILVNLTR